MIDKLKKMIISYVYIISQQPVKLQDLLMANQFVSEGIHLDGEKLGFRLKLGKAYLVFLGLVNIVLLPLSLVAHMIFRMADCHISIFIAIFVTGIIFAFFGIFRDWLTDEVAKTRIKMMWSLHFPLFKYEDYSSEINEIYLKSIDENIKKQDLERYILDNLSK
ncbi:MAG: hypothetical protein PHF17_03060 [Arcobacteraceae bacterium]|jgi:hypothetical protein|nr:hypothetical protein [Arcobacteraceae bacterium]